MMELFVSLLYIVEQKKYSFLSYFFKQKTYYKYKYDLSIKSYFGNLILLQDYEI